VGHRPRRRLPLTSDWTPVTHGESGATVLRSPDGTRYAKYGQQLAQERDRITWLATTGIPGPAVLDWHTDDDGAWLVTSAVHGVPADQVPAETLRRAWPAITAAVRALHALPPRECPFSRDLAEMFALASAVVARGAVNPAWLPVEQQHTPPVELLARLATQLPTRLADEDTVVCHGDLCLPNIIVTPETGEVTGFIDLGRLGGADRYADIALLLANARETWRDETEARAADEAFARDYDMTLDADRQRFYLHLDPLTWG
jgi:streptomycin 3"-kinase